VGAPHCPRLGVHQCKERAPRHCTLGCEQNGRARPKSGGAALCVASSTAAPVASALGSAATVAVLVPSTAHASACAGARNGAGALQAAQPRPPLPLPAPASLSRCQPQPSPCLWRCKERRRGAVYCEQCGRALHHCLTHIFIHKYPCMPAIHLIYTQQPTRHILLWDHNVRYSRARRKERGRELCPASGDHAPAAAHSPRAAPRHSSLHRHRCKEQRHGTARCERHSGACRCRLRRRRRRRVGAPHCPRLGLHRCKERRRETVQWAANGADAPGNISSKQLPCTNTHARLPYIQYTHDNLQDTSCYGIIMCGTAMPGAEERRRAL
jgi:hypothetical protein